MGRVFSFNFWVQTFISTFMTMVFIYLIKLAFNKVHVPVLSDIASAV